MRENSSGMAGSVLLLVSASHFLNDILQSIIPASLPLLKEENNLTFAEVGLITLVIQLTASLLQPVIGFSTDKRPMPMALPFGMMLSLIGLLFLAHSGTLSLILFSVALIGCGSAVFHPESARIAQEASGGRRGLAQAIFQVGGNGGAALGPIAAALIIIPYGQESIGWFAPAAALAALLLIRAARWSRRKAGTTKKMGPTGLVLTDQEKAFVFLILFVLMFSKQVYISSLSNFLIFFVMEKFCLDAASAQYVLFAFLAAGAAGTLLGGPITDRFGRRSVMLFSIVGTAPFALLIPYASLPLLILLVILAALIISSAFSAILVCALEAAPGRTGVVSGVFFGLSFGLGGIAAAFFGWLADIAGIREVFTLASYLPLLGLAALLLPKKAC